MGIRKRNYSRHYTSTQQRRNEIASILATGMLKAEPAIKPLSEKLSDSSHKGLELSSKTRLNVSTE
jgi:hypothetical protein